MIISMAAMSGVILQPLLVRTHLIIGDIALSYLGLHPVSNSGIINTPHLIPTQCPIWRAIQFEILASLE